MPTYNSVSNKFGIYSEDTNMIGMKKVTVRAESSLYPYLRSETWYDYIIIVS